MHLHSYIYIYTCVCKPVCVCVCVFVYTDQLALTDWLTVWFDSIRFDLTDCQTDLQIDCGVVLCHNLPRICTPSRLPTQDGNRRTGELPGEESETRWGPDFKRGNALLKRGQVSKPPKKTVVIRIGKIVGRVRWWRATSYPI